LTPKILSASRKWVALAKVILKASLVLNYIRSFLVFGRGRVSLNQILVVVPYLQQRELCLKTVAENEEFKGLIVATANTYQGHENTCVFFDSTAAANLDSKVGFVDDSNRLAVATTRHRCGLVVFGDSRIYSNIVVTENNNGGDDAYDEDEDEEDEVDEAETKNNESTSKLQQLFAWFADNGRVVSESAENPPEYICKQITKEIHEEARHNQKAREQQGDEHFFLATSRLPIPMQRIPINYAAINNRLGPLWSEQKKITNLKISRRNRRRQLDRMRSLTSCKTFKQIRKSWMLSRRSGDKRIFDPMTSIPSCLTIYFSVNLASPTSHFAILPLKSGSRWNGRATFIFALTTPQIII
jgi:superfamily I DNA and/or RNA helicase